MRLKERLLREDKKEEKALDSRYDDSGKDQKEGII